MLLGLLTVGLVAARVAEDPAGEDHGRFGVAVQEAALVSSGGYMYSGIGSGAAGHAPGSASGLFSRW